MALFVESLLRTNPGAIGGTADMPRTRRAHQRVCITDPEAGSSPNRLLLDPAPPRCE